LELEQLPPETIAAVAWDQPKDTAEIPVIQEGELNTLVDIIEKHAIELGQLED
jgi:hypothetical protein